MSILCPTLVLCFLGVFYLLPTIIAAMMHNRQIGAVFVINLLLGWTGLGWAGSLAMAVWK